MADADLVSLRLFLTMVELGNLTRAAERHHISASAVTRRIKELETNYRVILFERQSRGVVATAAGEEMARKVRDLFASLDVIKGTMSEFADGARGKIRVHASASVLIEALIDAISTFTVNNPFIRIELNEMMSWAIVSDVAEGRADVGVIAGSIEVPDDLVLYPYREDRLMLLMPKAHGLSSRESIKFEEILDYNYIGIGVTSAISIQLAAEAEKLNRNIKHLYRVATYDVARLMVAKGCGLTILPSSMASTYSDAIGLHCIPIEDNWARREMQICLRDEQSMTVASRLFVNHLRQS